MDKNSKINWLYIISIREFQSNLNLNLLKEISMVSKLTREKLKPLVFKNVKLSLGTMKFDSNVICIAYDNRYKNYDYKSLREENKDGVEDSLNDFIIDLNDIKKYTNNIFYYVNGKFGYFLYPLIEGFNNLTNLKMNQCHIPYRAFTNIGKRLPNLNKLELITVDLIKSTTDVISETDIAFPPNLTYLQVFDVQVITTPLISDSYEYLFNKKLYPASYESFTLLKISVPSLKRLDFIPRGQGSLGIEEFLNVNRNVKLLFIRRANLNISSKLNSLKSIDSDDYITFNNIDQAFRLTSIISLKLLFSNFNYSENVRRLCQLCPNLVNLSINFSGLTPNFHLIIDNYLAPSLINLKCLKTLNLIDVPIFTESQVLDFSKFHQIEKLKIGIRWGSALNIKFDECKSLKQIEIIRDDFKFSDEFKRKFTHQNWEFKFSEHTVKGYKI